MIEWTKQTNWTGSREIKGAQTGSNTSMAHLTAGHFKEHQRNFQRIKELNIFKVYLMHAHVHVWERLALDLITSKVCSACVYDGVKLQRQKNK